MNLGFRAEILNSSSMDIFRLELDSENHETVCRASTQFCNDASTVFITHLYRSFTNPGFSAEEFSSDKVSIIGMSTCHRSALLKYDMEMSVPGCNRLNILFAP